MPELPRGTVTFLFTDIAGSSRLWQEQPAAMRHAYARHDTILRHAITAHQGVAYKIIGDAIQAAFPTAPAATAAALQAQVALQLADWSLDGLHTSLRVRMALHTGAVDPDNGDYRSPVLNRLGRLLSAAHGGQIILSQATAELTRDHLPQQTWLEDLGEHRLKDLARPEQIWQLAAPELLIRFPPLLTLAGTLNNLPIQATTFLGREADVTAVGVLLQRSTGRLVTLTGPGGTGKTRLALQIAAEYLVMYPDGVWFVDLAALTDPQLVAPTIASVLGIAEESGRTLIDTLGAALRSKHLLLLLDNFEQVLAAADVVGSLLAAAPNLTVLVTSRSRLSLRAEQEYGVPPLPLPHMVTDSVSGREADKPEVVTQYIAVQLFIERAQSVLPSFSVDNHSAPAVAQICTRLDGLPLAIELAAARIRLLPPQALLARLNQRLPLLTGGARDVPARQRTLRAAIAWSYDLLAPAEQTFFQRLAVFAGGFTLEAATEVADPEGVIDHFEALTTLVDQSLVQAGTGPDDSPRFTLLETIREFALERLDASGETADAHTRLTTWCLSFADNDYRLSGGNERIWFDRLETEHDNIRTALAWAIQQQQADVALRFIVDLLRFWEVRAHFGEGLQWAERVHEISAGASPVLRAMGCNAIGELAMWRGEHRRAFVVYEEGLTLARRVGDPYTIWLLLRNLGQSARFQADYLAAQRWYDEALAVARTIGEGRSCLLDTLQGMGEIAIQRGDPDRGAVLFRQILAEWQPGDSSATKAYSLLNLAWIALDAGEIRQAAATYASSLSLFLESRDQMGTTIAVCGIAATALRLNHTEQAARLLSAGLTWQRNGGHIIEINEQDLNESTEATVHERLSEAAFSMAWAAGQALSLEQAASEALAFVYSIE